ncbi:hypothetical protein M0805_001241 [Coniferiporia weirii]|nr:hypothetical protein M0805_001241 [Coniferiporia weirii]
MLNSSSPSSSPTRSARLDKEQKQLLSPIANAFAPCGERSTNTASQKSVDISLAEPFAQFSHENVLVGPYDDELRRDISFQDQFHQQLLEFLLEFHAWSTSRPELESATAGDALFEETQAILNVEGEQESSRIRLLEFITRIKAALAALTDFGL